MKRIFIALALLVLIAAGAGWWLLQSAATGLVSWRAELARQAERAEVESRTARQRYLRQRADLEVLISRPVMETLFDGMEGFESVNKRGLKITLQKLTPTFREGFIHLSAEGEFAAPFYKGPIEASFYAFTRLAEDGSCRLDLRVAGARATGNSFLKASWLEALIVDRIQSKLKMPEIKLPLGFEHNLVVPAVDKTIETKGLTIQIPQRAVYLKVTAPRVVVTETYLGVFAQEVSLDKAQAEEKSEEQAGLPFSRDIPDGIQVSFRFNLLSEILAGLVEPEEDVHLSAERMEKVWYQKKRVLGLKVTNRADLVDVDGSLDIREGRLYGEGNTLFLDIAVGGSVAGRIEGRAYGLKLNQPFTIDPDMHESIPIEIRYEPDHLVLFPEPKTLALGLDVETELAGRTIRFHHTLDLESEELIRPIEVPHHFRDDFQVPYRMRGKTVLETRAVPLDLRWSLMLPEDQTGRLVFEGTVSINPSRATIP
ncbi:MAG: hypothetical protein QNK37_36720 [Acidobacteriota bacterium]|nr:hypothetical protein [Acidobacteriota bacterium]